MKHIHLHIDENFFYQMQENKLLVEKTQGENITWEDYVKFLFGFIKLNGGKR